MEGIDDDPMEGIESHGGGGGVDDEELVDCGDYTEQQQATTTADQLVTTEIDNKLIGSLKKYFKIF